jgi:hypothetical protein
MSTIDPSKMKSSGGDNSRIIRPLRAESPETRPNSRNWPGESSWCEARKVPGIVGYGSERRNDYLKFAGYGKANRGSSIKAMKLWVIYANEYEDMKCLRERSRIGPGDRREQIRASCRGCASSREAWRARLVDALASPADRSSFAACGCCDFKRRIGRPPRLPGPPQHSVAI